MWKKLGKQGEGFWKKHPNPTRFGNAKAPEQQWDSPRRVNLKFFCRCGSSHWMRPGVIIWNVIKQIFASYTSTVTGVCSCPTDVGLALGNEMLMNVAWTEVVGHALLDQRYLHKNNSPYSLPYPQFLLLGSRTNIHRANPHPSGTRSWAFQLSWTQLAARSMHICINASCNRSLSSGVICCAASVCNTDWLIWLEFLRARVTTWWEQEAAWRNSHIARCGSERRLGPTENKRKADPRLTASTFMDRQLCRDKLLLTDLPWLCPYWRHIASSLRLLLVYGKFYSIFLSFFMQKTDVLEKMNKVCNLGKGFEI